MKKFELEHLKEVINTQMEINGYKERFEDLQEMEDWFVKFTTTEEKEQEFREYLLKYLKPFTFSKKNLESEVGMFILNYGLKVLPDNE